MRIAEISANWGRGGPGGVMKDLYEVFTEKGEECLICTGRGTVPSGVDSYHIGSFSDNVFHLMRSRLFDQAGFGSKRPTARLIEKLQAYQPDIIHLHNPIGYYLDVEGLFSFLKTAGIPVLWTLHDCWAFTGHCINFEQAGCERWKSGCGECPLKNEYPECFLKDYSKRNFENKRKVFSGVPDMTLVTPSVWLMKAVKETFLNEYPLFHIPNGIDTERFHYTPSEIRSEYGLSDKTVLLAVAGVWNRMKGVYLLNEIAGMLGDSFRVVMIGDTGKNQLSPKIIHLNRTENVEELIKWYSAADMLINPTFGDNFPTVNLEALCCGTPVVTNATGGSPEASGNDAGRIVYTKTAEEFCQKILECENEHYSREYVRSFAEKYSRTACAEKYLELIRNITEE